jgi:hypothetical protein
MGIQHSSSGEDINRLTSEQVTMHTMNNFTELTQKAYGIEA